MQVSDGNQILVASDTITIASVKSGSDSYTVVLSNDSHTLPTTNGGTVTYTGSGTKVIVYKGSTELAGVSTGTPTLGQFKVTAVGSNITVGSITPGTPLVVGQHSAMTSDNADIEYTIDIESLQTVTKIQTFAKSLEGQDGSNGTDAKSNRLTADAYVITYDSSGVETPSGQSITLNGTAQNHSGVVYYDFLDEGVSKQNSTSNTYTILDGDEPIGNASSNWTLDTREGSSVGTIIASDTISIYGIQDALNGVDGLTAIVTNEAHTLPTTNVGVVNYTGSGTDIYVYEGNDVLAYDGVGTSPGTWKITTAVSDISIGSITDFGTFVRIGNASVMTSDIANITYTIIGQRADGSAFTLIKLQSFAKSNAGTDGTNGINGTNGTNGVDSQIVNLTASNYVIKYNSVGAETPGGQSITLTATGQNTVGTIYYQFIYNGASQLQNTTSNTHILTDGNEPAPGETVQLSVQMRQSGPTGTIIASDTLSVVGLQDAEGVDALTFLVTNEAHTLPATSAGVVTSYANSGTQIKVWEGVDVISYNGVGTSPSTFKIVASPTGITTGSFTDSGTFVTVNNHSSMTTDQATITYTITGQRADGQAFSATKTQSFGKSKAGTDGVTGTDAVKTTKGFVYYSIPQAGVPATPTATSFTFSTYSFAGLTANWSTSPPTASGNNNYWYSSFVAEEDAAGDNADTTVTFTTPLTFLAFTDLVTFTNLASTTGSTVINGGNISTGVIQSNNFVTGTAPYSSTGTQINLTNGTILTPGFGLDASGNASFNGAIEGGTIDIGGADTTSFHVNSAGQMWTGGASYATAPFRVNNDGDVFATDLEIEPGGFIQSNDPSNSGAFFLSEDYWLLADQSISGGTNTVHSNGTPIWFGNSQRQIVGENASDSSARGLIIDGDGYIKMTTANSPYDFVSMEGDLRVTGDITAFYSDERLKTNLGNITNPLDKIDSLNGFKYVNNDLAKELGYGDDKSQVGVSAQEVQAIMPEVVSTAPFDMNNEGDSKSGEDYLTVNYARLVPLLIEGIKELRAEVEELKKQIK